jgi:DNA-binding transcriptional MocR family regulator
MTLDGRGSTKLNATVDFRRSLPPVPPRLHEELAHSLAHFAGGKDLGTLMHESRARGTDRERLAGVRFLSSRLGADISPDRIMITNGAQSAFILLLRELVGSSGVLLAEALTYGALRPLAQKCSIQIQGVAIDHEGMLPDAFEQACRDHKPRALYCNPTLHNPTTAIMSLARRWELIRIARKYGVSIIEDEALARLYPDSPQPLATLAPEICWYVMSTTKCLSHGLRLAYVAAPSTQAATTMLASAEQLSFWVPTPLVIAIMTSWVENGVADLISNDIARECLMRERAATQILAGYDVRAPRGTMHLWLTLPTGCEASDFAHRAQATGVLLRPASHFSVDDTPTPDSVRLSLSTPATLDEVKQGLGALRDALEGGI